MKKILWFFFIILIFLTVFLIVFAFLGIRAFWSVKESAYNPQQPYTLSTPTQCVNNVQEGYTFLRNQGSNVTIAFESETPALFIYSRTIPRDNRTTKSAVFNCSYLDGKNVKKLDTAFVGRYGGERTSSEWKNLIKIMMQMENNPPLIVSLPLTIGNTYRWDALGTKNSGGDWGTCDRAVITQFNVMLDENNDLYFTQKELFSFCVRTGGSSMTSE